MNEEMSDTLNVVTTECPKTCVTTSMSLASRKTSLTSITTLKTDTVSVGVDFIQ